MDEQFVSAVVGVVLSGGLGAAIFQIASARAELRRVRIAERKAAPEAEAILLGGAQSAVVSLQAALDRAEGYITRLEKVNATKEERVVELESELSATKKRLANAVRRLRELESRITSLEDQ